MSQVEYTREKLIKICEEAIVPQSKWLDRDSPRSVSKVGEVWAYLKVGCEFVVIEAPTCKGDKCVTDDRTIWLEITHEDFHSMEGDRDELMAETFYLPTEARLKAAGGEDWY